MAPNFSDNFSKQSDIYAKFRPQYPDALFTFLSSLTTEHNLVWDCGTGNGQAAVSLAKYYQKVIATDPSQNQILHATAHPAVEYRVENAEQNSLLSDSADLITVANAVHWFHLENFYKEARRVLKTNGILAVWSYEIPNVTPEVDAVVRSLHDEILGEFWVHANHLVSDKYRSLHFPFERISTPNFYSSREMHLEDYLGYLHTWSATQKYISKYHSDPIDQVQLKLQENWGDPLTMREIRWELYCIAGRINN